MPLRPHVHSAVCAQTKQLIRTFSSTAAALHPPRDFPHHHNAKSHSPSSTESLLRINKPDAPARDRPNRHGGSGVSASAKLLNRYRDRAEHAARDKVAQLELLRNQKNSRDYLKQMPRNWDIGDVYSPRDLGPVEMQKWRKRTPRNVDVVKALGIRPEDMYKNFSLIQDFTTPSGAIQNRKLTGLSPVNQRKVAKMIRRAQGMGIYPTIHDHPELIQDNFYPDRK